MWVYFDCAIRWLSLVKGVNDDPEDAADAVIHSTCYNIRKVSLLERPAVEDISMQKVGIIAYFFRICFDESVIRHVQSEGLLQLASALQRCNAFECDLPGERIMPDCLLSNSFC